MKAFNKGDVEKHFTVSSQDRRRINGFILEQEKGLDWFTNRVVVIGTDSVMRYIKCTDDREF